jgi:uncharacterized protein YkwD
VRVLPLAGPILLAAVLGCAAPLPLALPMRAAPTAAADPATRPIEVEVIRLTNAHRRARALPVLREDPLLAALARSHSEAMARDGGSIDHAGVRGRFQRAAASLPLSEFAENVARAKRLRTPPASWVVSRWIQSEDHRVHLEGGAFDLVGVGVVRGPGGDLYFTQIFAAVRQGG